MACSPSYICGSSYRSCIKVWFVDEVSSELAASRCAGYDVVLRKSVDIVAFEELRFT